MLVRYSHLLHVLLVQDLLHGQQLDDPPGALVERRALLFGVAGVAEGDEEAALVAVGALALQWRRASGKLELSGSDTPWRVTVSFAATGLSDG